MKADIQKIEETLITVRDHLNQMSWREVFFNRTQLSIIIVTFFIFLCDGQIILTMPLVIPRLRQDWSLNVGSEGLLGTAVYVGFLIGSLSFGVLADIWGRRKVINILQPLLITFGILSALSTQLWMLVISRLICGILLGGLIPVMAVLSAETLPSSFRSAIMVFNFGCVVFGKALSAGEATVIDVFDGSKWRVLMGLATLPCAIGFVFSMFFLEESPRWLTTQGRFKEAYSLLYKITQNESFNDSNTSKTSKTSKHSKTSVAVELPITSTKKKSGQHGKNSNGKNSNGKNSNGKSVIAIEVADSSPAENAVKTKSKTITFSVNPVHKNELKTNGVSSHN